MSFADRDQSAFEVFGGYDRCALRSNDVNIEILYCGVCHTDIHTAHGEWDGLIYPNGTIYPLCEVSAEILTVMVVANIAHRLETRIMEFTFFIAAACDDVLRISFLRYKF